MKPRHTAVFHTCHNQYNIPQTTERYSDVESVAIVYFLAARFASRRDLLWLFSYRLSLRRPTYIHASIDNVLIVMCCDFHEK